MAILLLQAALAGCAGRSLSRFSYAQVHMGVEARVILYAPDEPAARSAARAAFARLAELDGVMSDYRQDSELMRLCAGPDGVWTPVSPDLFRVLSQAREISEATDGAFDCTIGPLSRLWREARRAGALPDPAEIAAARRAVGWRLVELDPERQAVRLAAPGMRLDLGGIGKGFGAQRALETLQARGISRCLVAMAGDVAAADPPPGERGWRVAVDTGYGSGSHPVVLLRGAAVSTSGDTEQFIEIAGVRYSHILDPRTGLGLTTRAAATVVSADGGTSDALASAACVMGPTRTKTLPDTFSEIGIRMVVEGAEYRFGPRADLITVQTGKQEREP